MHKLIIISLLLIFDVSRTSAVSAIFDDLWDVYSKGHITLVLDDGSSLTKEKLKMCLKSNDPANDYVYIECAGFVNTYQGAIFKDSNNVSLFVFIENGASVENRYYLKYVNTKKNWEEVNKKVLPNFMTTFKKSYLRLFPDKNIEKLLKESAQSSYRTILPQKGKIITIQSDLGLEQKNLFQLSWDKKQGIFQIVD